MKIFLDDQCRNDVRESWVSDGWWTAINFAEFKMLIEEAEKTGDKVEAISFDNDLGEGEVEGNKILKWLLNSYLDFFDGSVELRVHSQNRVERARMETNIKYWQEHIEELREAKNRPDPWTELDTIK